MTLFVTIAHIMLCAFLILIILLQPGKDSADIFGGGQGGNKMYGARSQSNPLGRATTLVAICFMTTSISLAWISTDRARKESSLAKKVLEMERAQKKEITFEVPKLRSVQAFALIDAPKPTFQIPDISLQNPLDNMNPNNSQEDENNLTPQNGNDK
ncbi:MAG: preprotein translocase subunit SecG [Myxococcota bacterium]|nr:preprotein translocase subunit SecG [Myxococcota bacterium]